ncbi:hypothetical protein B0919_05580 [Hymenobacter sp. CRA2]|nr:hypothetical protein B0919_05580 [Hymenobacter sp. CRA2]
MLWAGALLGCQPQADEQAAATTADKFLAADSADRPSVPAKPVAAAPVKVVTVAAGKEEDETEGQGRFELPQVQLPDAAVAARLNQAIVAASFWMEADWLQLSTRQAVQRCLREYQENDKQGLTSLSYNVVCNEHGVLTLALTSDYLGAYPYTDTRCFVFDTRTGRRLRVADLVRDTTALRTRWRTAISQRVAAHLRADLVETLGDSAVAAELPALLHWNAAKQQVTFEANEPRFDDFAVTRRGLTLAYSFGLPHVIQAAEPERDYSFTYAELRPWLRTDGPLVPWLP